MRFFIFFLSCLLSFTVWGQKKAVIDKFVKTKGFENASIGICVKDSAGKTIYEYNKRQSLTPASILKVVTTATALEMLGANHKIETTLAVDSINKNRLIVTGFGDPTLGSEYLDEPPTQFLGTWANIIKKQVQMPIEIVVDDSYFGYDGISLRWIREDIGNYYAAGSYGISLFDNAYKIFFDTMGEKPEVLKTDPALPELIFNNRLTLNISGQDNGYVVGEPFSNNRLLVGNIPSGRKSIFIKGEIPDPGLFFAQTLGHTLTEIGIEVSLVKTVKKDFMEGNFSSPRGKIFHTHFSAPLSETIRVINVRSNNHYAEHLLRQIARSKDKKTVDLDVLNTGIEQTKKFWEEKNLNMEALFMYDGCGLSPSNAVSAELMCDLLYYMQSKSKQGDVFFASLPRAGKEGTVRNLLKGTKLEGRVFVKSGSISGVQCFAGYILKGKAKYPFTLMVNRFTCPRRQVVEAIEQLLLGIAE